MNTLLSVKRFIPSRIDALIRKRVGIWLEKRIPPSEQVVLDHRRIFIFPTLNGLMFLGVVMTLFLAGINYQNNLILALCFLLVSLFLNAIFATYRNLSGLILERAGAIPVGAGETLCFHIKINNTNNTVGQSLRLHIPGQHTVVASLDSSGQSLVAIPFIAQQRGWCKPGRFHLQTVYPLGLIRSWSWIDLQLSCLVYPKPFDSPRQQSSDVGQGYQQSTAQEGVEDVAELRVYRQGDSPKHVDWKAFAKGRGLHTKTYQGYSGDSNWIDWLNWPNINQEQRLSAMTYWILTYAQKQEAFGLRLPSSEIPLDCGDAHVFLALKTVALFGCSDGVFAKDD
ncbi:MAG: DUF58 domain-containing protein [Pseudomonadales bacterium]|nr:DUF58 domain-containing protein [Pseudomonadales bacterium]